MGSEFSNCHDNDDFVDNLIDLNYIRTKKIEQVFRAVDRADYFLSSHKDCAYKGFAWKHGNIHLSAPCIYCEVMEHLDLRPGFSFLNLGSGTGYLNTMAGLMLTQRGTNHGIELHDDCVTYSYERLEEFKQKSLALDEFDFCEPVFVQGNCLNVTHSRCYDRVYCGATCPESHVAIIKEFVKVGGILIMPYGDRLVKATRVDENKWEELTILPVSFANLMIPHKSETACRLPDCNPLTLQELCREKIRQRLRENVWIEHSATLETRKPITSSERNRPSPCHRSMRQFIIPIFEESDENSSDDDDGERNRERTSPQLLFNVNGSAGENLRTTLQFVRAVVHPNRNRDLSESEDEYVDLFSRWADDENETPSTEEDVQFDTNFSSERERQDSESMTSSDSACDKSQSESHDVNKESEETDEKPQATGILSAYSNMTESESDSDEEDTSKDDEKKIILSDTQKRKSTKRNIDDSGIADDTGNEDSDTNGNSDLLKKTSKCRIRAVPVMNKRSNCSDQPNEPSRKRNTCGNFTYDRSHTGHYVDTNAFSLYMKEKIHQLPLPYSLKLYMNYNRTNL